MSDALPLPPRPSLEQYKKLAKDFQRACKPGDDAAVLGLLTRWGESIARLQGRPLTPEATQAVARDARRLAQLWRKERGGCSLSAMQLFLARAHDFKSWPRFADHVRALESGETDVEAFEAAADAIVDGDIGKLESLLRAHPKLARQRSTRAHNSTLLHYVSANGIEDFRQRTPQNIVAVARLLIGAGAEVNAVSDAYGGHSTVLGLVATSYHPDAAGVQIDLLQALIEAGHRVDDADIPSALHNGRIAAVEFLASRAASLDLPSAAAVGRLDLMAAWFDPATNGKRDASEKERAQALLFASQFGRTEAVAYLLGRGVPADARAEPGGATALHWASFGGHADIAALLLAQHAPANVVEGRHGGAPLGWAVYGWRNSGRASEVGAYARVIAMLVRAGAVMDPAWLAEDPGRSKAFDAAQAEPAITAALKGESPP